MIWKSLFTCLLVPAMALAHGPDADSIPEPTPFSVIASDAESTVVGSPILVSSDDSTAEIAVIEAAESGDMAQRGIRILLKRDGEPDAVYLDADQAVQVRDELTGMERWYQRGTPCNAMHRCAQGIARCRPSQDVHQAVCPGFFTTPDGDRGAVISTPRSTHSFPAKELSAFVTALDAAIGELIRQ